ncbi:hypothetical protein JW930_06225 [Candidatus Woesearchaeota archaeon]|nr:hypothetical protein [Candidatus Woesearchaeota archaeon]
MKSQMELFGIAMVVVVLTLGLFLFLGLRSQRNVNIQESYATTKIAQNMLNVMLEVKTDCGVTMSEIIKDSANLDSLCSPSSKEYAEAYLGNLFAVTLEKWNKPYLFTAKQGSDELIRIQYLDCDETKEKEAPGVQPIPSVPPIIVRLDICK